MSKIHFGTDGWRAVISDDFTFENVKVVAQAMADYVKSQKTEIRRQKSELYGRKYTLAVGYDTRFLSEKYAELIACVMAANGIKVILADGSTPTPSVSFTIAKRKLIGGVMVTASHNPARYNGIKYKGYFGGSVGKDITNNMESRLYKTKVKFMEKDAAVKKGLIKIENIVTAHLDAARKFVNMRILKKAKLRILVDSMHGTGDKYMEELLKGTGNIVTTIHSEREPYFGGNSPEPNEVHLKKTALSVKKGRFDVALATDGDSDRLGVILPNGKVASGHKIMTMLLLHLLEDKGLRGAVVQTICGTGLINKIAQIYGLKTYETAVGFKFISELFLRDDILIGGEETGGITFKGWVPERDGFASGLLLLEMMAERKRSLGKILEDIDKEYGVYVYKRFDLYYSPEKKKKLLSALRAKPFRKLLGREVVDVKSFDGFKFIRKDASWLMLRPSGTEPKLRVYSEGRSEREAIKLIEFGKKFALNIK